MHQPPTVRFLRPEELRAHADDFLKRNHPSRTLPIPIEHIVERLGLNIIPVPGLQQAYRIVGCMSADMTGIYVDQWVAESRESRFYFTLAHEMGHIELHAAIFESLRSGVNSFEAWLRAVRETPDDVSFRMEWQAHTFAGLVLVPFEALQQQYHEALPDVQTMMSDPALREVPKEQIRDFAWEALIDRLAHLFGVSNDVIQKRLKFEKITPDEL